MKKHVLIIGDELAACRQLKYSLENETTAAYYTLTVYEGLKRFIEHPYCLVILDIHLKAWDGYALIEQIRRIRPIPILVISAGMEQTERLSVLEAGAQVYLEKPYELDLCLAQAKSLMSLYMDLADTEKQKYSLVFGKELVIDSGKRKVILNGKTLKLTKKEFDLLFCLVKHAGQVLSREQLYVLAWEAGGADNVDDVVKTHIKMLRKKLQEAGGSCSIHTEWGIGYRFLDGDAV